MLLDMVRRRSGNFTFSFYFTGIVCEFNCHIAMSIGLIL